jgi:Glycosyl hydrolase family 20, domain 2
MKAHIILAIAVTLAVSGTNQVHAAGHPNRLPFLLPTPQHMVWTQSEPARLDLASLEGIAASWGGRGASAGFEQVNARIEETGLPALTVNDTDGGPGETPMIWVGLAPWEDVEARFEKLPEPGAEGYRLRVAPEGVVVLGQDVPGIYYGLMTLRRLIQPDGKIPMVTISDWPDLPFRGTYIAPDAVRPEDRIPYFASLKLNHMLIETGDFYHLDDPVVRARWQACFSLCREHQIEPIPELQSLGWGQFVLAMEPLAVEAVFAARVPFVARDGSIEPPPGEELPPILFQNPGFEDGDAPDVAGWEQDAVDRSVAIDLVAKHGGHQSLRLWRREPGIARVWQDLPCRANAGYELGCHLKTDKVEEGGAYVEVYGLEPGGALGALLAHSPWRKGTEDWQRESVTFATQYYQRIRVYLRIQDATGRAWFDDVTLTGSDAVSGQAILRNVIRTAAAPLVVTDASGQTIYGEGKDYEVIPGDPPEYRAAAGDDSRPYGPTAKPLQLRALDGGRIADGQELLVSCNYAPPDSITACPSEPLYRDLMREAITNVVRYLNPKYIHIGHDEPRVLNRDSRCRERGLNSGELFVDDVKRMRRFAKEANPNVRVMMWADAVNPYHNAPHLGMESAAEGLPRDIILCPWFYTSPKDNAAIEQSITYFTGLGFDVTGSPWYGQENAWFWATTLAAHRKESPHVLGALYTSWADGDLKRTWDALEAVAEYAWTAGEPELIIFEALYGKRR